ncbi:histidine phosphatase family protein [Companilactobacillus kimchiensis]|uniref:Putative phosphoglycerate mutase (Putative) n=1 Tax=Companilactobacillus kimchiensis TaxID=993692 RepID=A0A0R2LF35_9LACO|nr:histidine phosphatase family protein [Companilactobacillus kimchiensis]KRO00193.1 putative phosphoglycerate mutase (putative) [Companilactobacillus kimchiensis]
MKKTLYLMRHGQTLFNVQHKIQGWCDSPLTETGIKQAQAAKKYFNDNEIDFDAAYCSTAERSSDTLELVTNLPYTRLKGLRELSFGAFEGEQEYLHPKDDPKKHFGDYYVQFGGEDNLAAQQRVNKTLLEIMNQDNSTVLAVSHAGACMMFSDLWTDMQKLRDGGFTNCSILKFSFENNKFIFEKLINV